MDKITIIINDTKKEITSGTSISLLISNLALNIEKIAIEKNQEIIHLENYPKNILQNGDSLEIIHFVGGG